MYKQVYDKFKHKERIRLRTVHTIAISMETRYDNRSITAHRFMQGQAKHL